MSRPGPKRVEGKVMTLSKGGGYEVHTVAPPPQANDTAQQGREHCSFYTKVGACRYGDQCGRGHFRPTASKVIMIPNMHDDPLLRPVGGIDELSDSLDSPDEEELIKRFEEFFEDAHPEFAAIGKVVQFKVCRNMVPHLRGNVFVQYSTEEEAARAVAVFDGRFFGGRRLTCELVPVTSWKVALCGVYDRRRCPKGESCNFLHVFNNPRNMYREADFDWDPPKWALNAGGDDDDRKGDKKFERRNDGHGRPERHDRNGDRTERNGGGHFDHRVRGDRNDMGRNYDRDHTDRDELERPVDRNPKDRVPDRNFEGRRHDDDRARYSQNREPSRNFQQPERDFTYRQSDERVGKRLEGEWERDGRNRNREFRQDGYDHRDPYHERGHHEVLPRREQYRDEEFGNERSREGEHEQMSNSRPAQRNFDAHASDHESASYSSDSSSNWRRHKKKKKKKSSKHSKKRSRHESDSDSFSDDSKQSDSEAGSVNSDTSARRTKRRRKHKSKKRKSHESSREERRRSSSSKKGRDYGSDES
ncbi:U2 small nuclear ribonucleoprotein auxiliary factor 35 kDa subunit- protein 2 [Phlyctochytrium planicorne]|nr:U2 small nuclear ribonucleoprotein auxiliary factor 35 kDa subunit- protein 2 [Phlyctochytrium planicorne]